MKTSPLIAALVCCCALTTAILAQAPKAKTPAPKTPADLARDEFNKVRNDQGKNFDQARFDKVIQAGIKYLEEFPTQRDAPDVVRNLVGWPDTVKMDPKTSGAMRMAYVSQLKFTLLNEKAKESLNEDAKAALAALDVAAFDVELRGASQPGSMLNDLREKINELTTTPKAGRYLADRELSYFQVVKALRGPDAGETQLKKLTEHKEKSVADMAKRELNILELQKDPVNWKLKGIDGKEFDFAANRGKVVAMYFWTSSNKDIGKNLDQLQMVHSSYRKKGVELVTVSYDKAEDREKLQKFMKENGVKCFVHFDGTGNKNEFGSKLNLTSTPKLTIFDQKGTLKYTDLQANQFEGAVKQLTEPPKKK
jgi:peroxiredoxin